MQAEVWKKIEELVRAAQALAPEKRAEFIEQACPDDPHIRAEVQSLLGAAPDAESFLESSPIGYALTPGAKLGHFEILGLLGRGGMGEVYRARDTRLKREVAIKVLPASFARDQDRIARFEREARAACALNHPNIVSVFDIGRDNSTYWIVSELVDGETLRRTIDRGPLPTRKATEIAVQIAEGLAAAHAAGIVHRDLKPGNIMVTREGRVKILDFGLAKYAIPAAAGDDTQTARTSSGVVMGTPGYMSPEQVRGQAIDHRSDIFSLGVIFYEMLAGKQAFSGGSSVEVMNAILKDDPPELPPSVPPGQERIVRRCLEKETSRRFQSAADLGFALLAVSGMQTAASPADSSAHPAWLRWIAVAASACLVAAGAYWLGARSDQQLTTDTTLRRLTSDSGLTTDAVISADGKLVAYASDRADGSNLDIWMQQVDGSIAVRLTKDMADEYDPAFSPDGTRIAFRSERDGGGIYEIPALGGGTRLLVPKGRRPRFSPDGQFLMYWTFDGIGKTPRMQQWGSHTRLLVQALSGGTTTQLGPGCADIIDPAAVWSPDSRHVLFMAVCNNRQAFWLSSLDGKTLEETKIWDPWLESDLFSRGGWNKAPVLDEWTSRPSRLLIPVTGSDNGASAAYIAVLPISGNGKRATGPFQKLTYGAGEEASASASSNGRIVLSTLTRYSHIWGLAIDENGKATGEPKQLTSEASVVQGPGLSRDGTQLAFMEWRAGVGEVYLKNLVTGAQRLLAQEPHHVFDPVFNTRATTLAYMADPATARSEMHQIATAGGAPEQMWAQAYPDIGEQIGNLNDWSTDGDSLLISAHDGAHYGITTVDRQTARATRFLTDPRHDLWQSHFSNDGRWVTFNALKLPHSQIYAVPFRRGLVPESEWIPVTDGNTWDDKQAFSQNGKLIFFISDRDGYQWCIWAQRLGLDMRPTGSPFAVYHSLISALSGKYFSADASHGGRTAFDRLQSDGIHRQRLVARSKKERWVIAGGAYASRLEQSHHKRGGSEREQAHESLN